MAAEAADPTQLDYLSQIATNTAKSSSGGTTAGGATAALQPAINGDGGSLAHVTNFPATQPVTATALPLPAGAATAALQPVINADGGAQVHVMNVTATQAVSVATLPLPAGAATSASQAPLTVPGVLGVTGQTATVTPASSTASTDPLRLATANPDVLPFSGSVTAAGVIASADTTGYSSVAVQVTSPGVTCTITYEGSNDNINWVTVYGFTPALALGAISGTSIAAVILYFPVILRYFRARVSTFTSGTVTISGYLRDEIVPQLDPQSVARTVSVSAIAAPIGNVNANLLAKVLSAATNNPVLVKATLASLVGFQLTNTSSSAWAYVHFFALATTPVPGTSVPTFTVALAPNGKVTMSPAYGLFNMLAGLGYSITGGAADLDATVVAAAQVVGFILYK